MSLSDYFRKQSHKLPVYLKPTSSMENSGSPAPLGDKTNTTIGGKQIKSSFYYIIKFSVLFILLMIIKVSGL
jgi:hypothetical protein